MKKLVEGIFDWVGALAGIAMPITVIIAIIFDEYNISLKIVLVSLIVYSFWYCYCWYSKRHYWAEK